MELEPVGGARKLDIQELEEIRNNAYDNARSYRDKTKLFHDKKISQKHFSIGQKVLLYNSMLKLFLDGVVEIESEKSGKRFTVNGQRLKPFFENFQAHTVEKFQVEPS
ncbi:uncharacterized protein LOC108471586 [Gossypium arboreum]|uniref:uncharacterized protein LOC108471586 n=1 Tax=Gossypium arboreum TaxID=29729 RepID=UPI0008196C4A|nr:uncharacterized protein LOC108471586 [Gossypium arboreum]